MRCRSWKITGDPHRPLHRPGECDLCWEPCYNHVQKTVNSGNRCQSCWHDLTRASMNDTTLALSLLKEDQVPDFVLDELERSDVLVVSQAALHRRTLIGA